MRVGVGTVELTEAISDLGENMKHVQESEPKVQN